MSSMAGDWNDQSGVWRIDLGDHVLEKGEEITLTYKWQPHYLHGAEVMVRLNNEDRFVPIADLQKALRNYLGDD
jgi:hypothetical protein